MTSKDDHRTYVLRIWTEQEHGRSPAFRAALLNVATREMRYFSDVAELAVHLKSLPADAVDPEA